MTDSGVADRLRIVVLMENSVPQFSNLTGVNGVSFLIEATAGGRTQRYLMDVAQSPAALLDNMKKLGVAPESIDAVILSHCHFDHTTGLAEVVRAIGKRELPIISHPEVFRPHFTTRPTLRMLGMRDGPDELVAAGGRLLLTVDPLSPSPGVITTGEVPRLTEFEDAGAKRFTIRDGRMEVDPVPDDLSLVCRVPDGLVVITGCAHAGLINILRQAMKITGTSAIRAVIGGLHLVESNESQIECAVTELLAIGPQLVAAGHCTGTPAQTRLRAAGGGKWVDLKVGMSFEF